MRPAPPSSPSYPSSPMILIPHPIGATTPLAYYTEKGYPTLLDNYRPIALMNILLKLWTALTKDAYSKYAKNPRQPQRATRRLPTPSHHQRRPRLHRHDVGGRKNFNKDIYIMYADFKGALNNSTLRTTALCSITCADLVCPPTLSTHTNNSMVYLLPTISPLRLHPLY
jgi:hypothetical protein